MNIHVNGDIERLIQAVLASGKFTSAEEFVAAMATEWQDREQPLGGIEKATGSESAFEAFDRIGVIGCMQFGASDLATNPKHMDGFGT